MLRTENGQEIIDDSPVDTREYFRKFRALVQAGDLEGAERLKREFLREDEDPTPRKRIDVPRPGRQVRDLESSKKSR